MTHLHTHLDTLLWQAAHPDQDPAERDAACRRALDQIDQVLVPPLPTDDEGYRQLARGRKVLSSLYCYAFNREHPAFERVSELESQFSALQARYNRRFLVTAPTANLVARAHLWTYSLTGFDCRALWVLARDNGVLAARRHPTTGMLMPRIIGLQRSVGSNSFTMDALGRQRRRHLPTIGRQAFVSERRLPRTPDHAQAFLASVPLLDELWTDTEVGDHKHGATGTRMSYTDRMRLHQMLSAVPDETMEASLPAPRTDRALAA